MSIQILVVDDEPTLRTVISEVLSDDGHEVTTAASGEEALGLFRESRFSIVMTDIIMGRMSGLDLLAEIRQLDPNAIVIMMTSQATLESATSALRSGAYDFLVKPFEDLDVISGVINRAAEKHALLQNNLNLMGQLKKKATELQALNTSLEEMANRDGLTGLFNHRYFRDEFEKELARSRNHGPPLALIFLDVDHFKRYNDTRGHLAGDDVLKRISALLEEASDDSVLCARYGGEEFVVLMPGVDLERGLEHAELLRRKVEENAFPGGDSQQPGRLTISLGVAAYPGAGSDCRAIIRRADEALYEAKQRGRNAVVGWSPDPPAGEEDRHEDSELVEIHAAPSGSKRGNS